VAEGARLESVFTRKGNVGSNPTLSANLLKINDLTVFLSYIMPHWARDIIAWREPQLEEDCLDHSRC
jgi:hypothetical protein